MIVGREIDSLIAKYKDKVRDYFVNAVNNSLLPFKCENQDELVGDMCDAFWEDIFIELDLKKIMNFSEDRDFNVDNTTYWYDLVQYKNPLFDSVERSKRKLQWNVQKVIGTELWKKLEPFFLYLLPDVDENILLDFNLETFGEYDFMYSLGLLVGHSEERNKNTIISSIKKIEKELVKKGFKDDKRLQKILINEVSGYFQEWEKDEFYTNISMAVLFMRYFAGKRTLGNRIDSDNFFCMRELMKKTKMESLNRGFVVYCFNLLTDWYNYAMYLRKKDSNIMNYRGLALKQVAGDFFCIEDCAISQITKDFWIQTEQMRETIAERIGDAWIFQEREYVHYAMLFDEVVEDKLELGNKRDYLDYWILRFGENNIIEEWGLDREELEYVFHLYDGAINDEIEMENREDFITCMKDIMFEYGL